MADYEKMYKKLFNSVTDVIEALQQAQNETEDIYIDSSENKVPEFKVIRGKKFDK